jgi:hypothetical protein
MTTITSAQLRKNMKTIFKKVEDGEEVFVKYYNKTFTLKPGKINPDKTKNKKKLSPQARKILNSISSEEHKQIMLEAKKILPELYSMNPKEEKEYIRSEKIKKYGF